MQMPPINELYLATHIRNSGIEVAFIDAQMEAWRYQALLQQKFREINAILIMSSTQSFKQDIRVLHEIKEQNSDVISILFGSHPTFMPDYCLQEDVVDYIIRREPEETARLLLQSLEEKKPVENLPGIGFRTSTGTIHINHDAPFIKMDRLPIPDRSLLPSGVDYFNPVVKRVPYTTMQTSRGCPGRCIFCTAPEFYGKKYRFRSAENVLEELREIKRLGYQEVFIRDETFTAMKKRNLEICEGMIREKLDLSWIANGRVDMIDKETMITMKRAGCHMLKFGVETGSNQMLKNYQKGTTVAQAEAAFRWTHEVGLETHAHMIIGGPGESHNTIDKSVDFVKRLDPTTVSFGIVTPYPGTKLFDMVADIQPEICDGSDSTMQNLHTEGFYSEAICALTGKELSRAVVRAYRSIYLSPNYLLKRIKGISSIEHFTILAIAGMNILTFSITGKK